ncbi:MAG: hypothetical protein AB7U45_07240 [Desulfamplus sp.]
MRKTIADSIKGTVQDLHKSGLVDDITIKNIENCCVIELEEDSPLYNDMLDIKERKEIGKLEFMTHEEVWSD